MLSKIKTLNAVVRQPDQLKSIAIDYGRLALIKLGFVFYHTDRFYRGNDDRRILETQILPWYASRTEFRHIVFTGNSWYTMGYRKLFPGCRWRVIEICPRSARRYGGEGCINASVADADQYLAPESVDLVLFSGVFGYGLDTREELEKALAGFHRCLRQGGEMLFSWDDIPEHMPFDPLTSPSFAKFERILFAPMHTDIVRASVPWNKTWIFLRKAGPDQHTSSGGWLGLPA